MEEKDTLQGTVENVIYKRNDTNFMVLDLDSNGEMVTVTGILPFVRLGDTLKLTGEWITHESFGRQFKAEYFEKIILREVNAVYRFLKSGVVKGIGEATAKKIIEAFGEEIFDVLESDPIRLTKIRGVSEEKALSIAEEYNAEYYMSSIISFLDQYKISPLKALEIYKRLGVDAVEKINSDPYILCREISGMDFPTVDKIASEMGFSFDFDDRLKAGVMHVLKHNLNNGHTFLPKKNLLDVASSLLGIEPEQAKETLDDLLYKEELIEKKIGKIEGIYLKACFDAEKDIAMRIVSLNYIIHEQKGTKTQEKIEEKLSHLEDESGILYEKEQRRAVLEAVSSGVFILTGGPGTGKTTTLRAIISVFESLGKKVQLAAPTGRAAKRLSEVSLREAKTLHRLLEQAYVVNDIPVFARGEKNPLEADVVIVDECSMADIFIFDSLLKALKPGTSLVLSGDANQLPSVGPGNVLKDILLSGEAKAVVLSEIFRQAKESLIVVNAHRINAGDYPDLSVKDSDFFFLRQNDPDRILNLIPDLYNRRLKNAYHIDDDSKIQVITPTKKTKCGTVMLNSVLQQTANPPETLKGEIKFRDTIFRAGDKVMQIKNNYDIVKVNEKTGEVISGVYNGDIGRIISADKKLMTIKVAYDEFVAEYGPENFSELSLAYAVTVHKSQGSEFDVVIIPLYDGPTRLYNRNLLYTAVTRAKIAAVLVGKEEIVEQMVDNDVENKRFSGLRTLLREASKEITGKM